MPEFKPRKGNPYAIAILLLVTITSIYFVPEIFLGFICIFLLIVCLSYFEQPKIDRHFDELLKDRKELSIGDFAKEFDCKEVDTWVIRAVYEQVQAYVVSNKHIAIKSSDKLKEDLHIDDEDLDLDLVEEISQRSGRTLEGYESNPYYGKVKTVKDLVLFFNNQAKAHSS